VIACATILWRVKSSTRALARHYRPGVGNLQLRRATFVQVRDAASITAVASATGGSYSNAHVVPVHEAHVVEILAVAADGEFRKGDGWDAAAGAHKLATVTGVAFSVARSIKGAPSTTPKPA
jgi:hypothetical protein